MDSTTRASSLSCLAPALRAASQRMWAIAILLLLLLPLPSCHESPSEPRADWTLVSDLYDACFPRCLECAQSTVDALLYLDTINLPSQNVNIQKLVLNSDPQWWHHSSEMIEFHFTGTLPAEIDPGVVDERGWKVRIAGAALVYCDGCWTDSGLADVLFLRGDLSQVQFIHDPDDKVRTYLRRRAPDPRGI
jgi:hypothetical protein